MTSNPFDFKGFEGKSLYFYFHFKAIGCRFRFFLPLPENSMPQNPFLSALDGMNFTTNEKVRAAFSEIVLDYLRSLARRDIRLSADGQRRLIRKLAHHCVRNQWQQLDGEGTDKRFRLSNLADQKDEIVDAFVYDRLAITDGRGIKEILWAQTARKKCAASVTARAGLGPALVFAHRQDPDYTLVELTAPEHLIAESDALLHCLGTRYNEKILEEKGLHPREPGSERYLDYAIAIRNKRLRIFSLRYKGQPRVTLAYDVRREEIIEIEGGKVWDAGDPEDYGTEERDTNIKNSDLALQNYFPALCAALYGLKTMMPIKRIRDLFELPNNMALTRDGDVLALEHCAEDDILLARIKVTGAETPEKLRRLCADSRFTLDITGMNPRRLPEAIAADLFTLDQAFVAPQLERVQGITAPNAQPFLVPGLDEAGEIYAPEAKRFFAPNLVRAGDLKLYGCENFSANQLRRAGAISGNFGQEFSANLLQRAGVIEASRAKKITLPSLRYAEGLDAAEAQSIALPQATFVGHLISEKAVTLHAPELERAHGLRLDKAGSVYLPKLKMAIEMFFPQARSVRLPLLQRAAKIEAPLAEIFEAPHLDPACHVVLQAGAKRAETKRAGAEDVGTGAANPQPRRRPRAPAAGPQPAQG